MEHLRSNAFADLRKIVVKIGTRIIISEKGTVNHRRVNGIISDTCRLIEEGRHVVLVSSGAVGFGMSMMGLTVRPKILAEKQACAAAGQIRLMRVYSEKFQQKGRQVAQILLSAEDFKDSGRFNNIRRTVQALLDRGIVPVINENDTISTEELKVGDNDKLSSDVAHFLEADLLIILSDERGLYTGNPKVDKKAKFLAVVPRITSDILNMAGGKGSAASVGGMKAKLSAVRQAVEGGTPVVLTNGRSGGLHALIHGENIGTLFLPNPTRLKRRQRWLAFVSNAAGRITVDEGGCKALQKGSSSLLAVGITGAEGSFIAGNFVQICTPDGQVIARGKTAYSRDEVLRIKGCKSRDIQALLGRKGPEEVIHRDNLVLFRI